MGLDIGRLLYGIRTKYQISVNDICRGICGVSTYCMYENDEMIPDILSVNIFLDRMGFGMLNWNPSFQFASLSSDLANRLHK